MGAKNDGPLAEAFGALFRSPESIEYAVVDAFVGDHCKGNPAAVVLLSEWKDDKWLQDIAVEFNLSETAYIVKKETEGVGGKKVGAENEQRSDSKGDSDSKGEPQPQIQQFDLRWFTPVSEVNLCGHATLAAAHLLYHSGVVSKKDTIYFHTKGGLLSTRSVAPKESETQHDSSDGVKIPTAELVELNFPWITTTPSTVSAVEALPETLSNVSVVAAGKASNDYLIIELESIEDLDKLQPSMQELVKSDSFGLVATAPGGKTSGFDFASRCFFPKQGLNEDPVCGSAHCVLGPYWSTKLEKNTLLAHQASKRGGRLVLELDKKSGRVYISGQSTISMIGVLVE